MSGRIKKLFTFPIDADLAAGLKLVKQRDGITEAEQIRRGIRLWLHDALRSRQHTHHSTATRMRARALAARIKREA